MSDITIADFWGIENIAPEIDDDKGTSLFIVQIGKGKNVLEETKDKYTSKEVSFGDGIRSNISYYSSVSMHKERIP